MSVSETQICNLALLEFGDVQISSINEATKQARACKVLYPIYRDQLTASQPWNFAIKRADISAEVTDTPDFEWSYAYTVPADCLRVLELYGNDAEWVVENGQLLTNLDEEIYIKYITQVTTTGRMPPAYVSCLGKLLGAHLAAKLSTDKKIKADLLSELHTINLPEARRLNAIEGKKPREKDEQPLDEGNSTWQLEGR
jgi:hypothetical protein